MNDRPWMMALEAQFAAIRSLDAQGSHYGRINMSSSFQDFLRRADTYSWSKDTSRAVALASRSIPLSSRLLRSSLPGNGIGWWWFSSPLDIAGADIAALLFGCASDGQLWFQTFVLLDSAVGRALLQVRDLAPELSKELSNKVAKQSEFLRSRSISLLPLAGWSFEIDGRVTVADFADRMVKEKQGHVEREATCNVMMKMLLFFLAGCAWLEQRIISFSSGPVERHRRKQLARENDAPLPSDVKVIQLRRVESESRLPSADGLEQVDWSCRWVVNGHWRNQPYKEERKLIYIMPFVKGPADKPLRVPTHTVYAVNR